MDEHLESVLPNLETLILTNNNIEDLTEVDHLKTIKSLRSLRFAIVCQIKLFNLNLIVFLKFFT